MNHLQGKFTASHVTMARKLLDDGLRHDAGVHTWRTVGESPGCTRIPIQPERSIYGNQHVPYGSSVVDHYHAAYVCSATHQTLANSHHFRAPVEIDRPFTRAILARDLTDASVQSEVSEGVRDDPGNKIEPFLDPLSGRLVGLRQRERQCCFVEHRSPAAGKPFHRGKTMRPGSVYRVGIPGLNAIGATKSQDSPRHVEPEHRTEPLSCNGVQDCSAHCHVHGRVLDESLSDQRQRRHGFEHKEMLVPSPHPAMAFGGTPQAGSFVESESSPVETGDCLRLLSYAAGLIALAVLTAACGDAPLQSLGDRSSDWVNEPTIVTTTTVPVTIPLAISTTNLKWFNDDIGGSDLDDPTELRRAIFERRGGDLFVQSSRAEIAALVPALNFPARAPYLAEYVTSQLVFDTSGELSDEPTAAFGIWSAEPYTRSRSVAQMAVLRVARDEDAAVELSEPGASISCARFADRTTESCEIVEIGGVSFWSLDGVDGSTLVWFDGIYRYELFARRFVPERAVEQMVLDFVALSELEPTPE